MVAELLTKVDSDRNSPNFGTLYLDQESIVSPGLEYDEDTVIQFIGGFEPIKASGQVAKTEVIATRRYVAGGSEWTYTGRIIDGGSGYSQPPRVMILNGPPNMSAVATIDPTTGKVSDVHGN